MFVPAIRSSPLLNSGDEVKCDIMSEGQKIQAEGYGDMVIQKLHTLRQNNELCDFRVSADGRVFEVHKALLAATSDYFRVMFGGVMAESKQDTVDLKGVTADGLQQVIDFIYSGEMALHYENLTEIINTASHLQVASALDVCSTYIKSLMTFDNAEDFLNIADTYSLEKVLTHWENMIQEKFYDFSQTQAYLKMDAETLSKHLSRDSLRITSEYQLLCCLDKWFRSNPMRIVNDGFTVFSKIRFPLMSEQELAMVRDSEIIQRCSTQVKELVRKGYHYHDACKKGHPMIDESTRVRSNSSSIILIHHGTSYMPFQVTAYNSNAGMFYSVYSDVNGSRDCRIASVDNFAYICRVVDFGGGTLMSSLFRFDPRHLIGQELRPMRRLRIDFTLVSFNRSVYAFGGSTEQFAILDSVERYSAVNNTWEDIVAMPAPTHSLSAIVYGERIYLSGGISGQDRQTINTFISFDPATQRYETKPGMFYARRLHDMVAYDGSIYVLGGIPRPGVPLHGQIPIECFSFHTNQWTMLSSTLSGRSVGHYINFEGQILSLGHEHHNATEDEIWAYDTDLDDWSKYAKAPQRMSLNSAICTQLYVNFDDEKIAKKFIKEK
ncbi:kelch-like protein 9 isoform X1 [Haliotis rubra]|uniref:kelch-like protein 9 isoform X1 n=2 Tax=Haliotis rubra TaxID=36100 RepID=UPI001EE5E943|nr:kelch-like protein 9 isoform X1 [Haliotis rubra]XP_046584127.1 kelch-like protein 9 isoform X1 [Haliotis rubra]XP_046584128.1 kelch-like protein 9 isoform X1 [Haliotis rubra]